MEARRQVRRASARARAAQFRRDTADLTAVLTGDLVKRLELPDEVADLLAVRLWINGTIHATATGLQLAETADDSRVERLGMPGRVQFHSGGGPSPSGGAAGGGFFLPRPASGDGDGILVAIVDGEVGEHASLKGRLHDGANLTQEPWGVPDDHATMLAGLVAGDAPDYRGVAPAASLRTYKIRAWDVSLGAGELAAGAGVQAAVEDGADIVLCAWGVIEAGAVARARLAFDGAASEDVLVVKSAGNDGPNQSTLSQPAGGRGVLVVGACDRHGRQVTSYSGRGSRSGGVTGPTCVTWGGEDTDPLLGIIPGGGALQRGTGTSYAAAIVAGLAACLATGISEPDPDAVRAAVVALCRPIPGLDDYSQGMGAVLTQP